MLIECQEVNPLRVLISVNKGLVVLSESILEGQSMLAASLVELFSTSGRHTHAKFVGQISEDLLRSEVC